MKRHDGGNIGGRQFPNFGRNVETQGHVIHLAFSLGPFLPLSFLEKQLFDKILIE